MKTLIVYDKIINWDACSILYPEDLYIKIMSASPPELITKLKFDTYEQRDVAMSEIIKLIQRGDDVITISKGETRK